MTSIARQTRTTAKVQHEPPIVARIAPPTWVGVVSEWTYRSRVYCRSGAAHVPDVWNWARLTLAPGGGVTRIIVWGPRDGAGWKEVWACPVGEPPLPVEAAKAIAVLNADVSGENTGLWQRSNLKVVMSDEVPK